MNLKTFLFGMVDVETTGLNPKVHEVREVALGIGVAATTKPADLARTVKIGSWSFRCDKEKADPAAVAMMEKSGGKWSDDSPTFREAMQDESHPMTEAMRVFRNETSLIIGHFLAFDLPFLEAGLPPEETLFGKRRPVHFCTKQAALAYTENTSLIECFRIAGEKLPELAKELTNVKMLLPHTAMGDLVRTWVVFQYSNPNLSNVRVLEPGGAVS